MRSIVVAAAVLSSTAASADVSKAWQAAKDNLPDTMPAVAAVDVAAILKLPASGKLIELFKQSDRDVAEMFDLVKSACNVDATAAISGFVIAGDPNGNDDDAVLIFQLAMDRPKASTCIEAMLRKAERKKQVTVQQTGIYTEVSVGGDAAHFAWLDKNVVAFNLDPGNKARLETSIGKKGAFGKSPVGSLLGKLDTKAAAFGAIKLAKPLERDLPFVAAVGSVKISGNNLSGLLLGTATDETSAKKFTTEANRELGKETGRAAPALKKLLRAIDVTSAATEVTVKASATAAEVYDAFNAVFTRKPVEPPAPPPAP